MDTNDLVYKIAARVKTLANERTSVLRLIAGPKYMNRGELIEIIITEEFCKEFPDEINSGE